MSAADGITYCLIEFVGEWMYWNPRKFPLFWRRCFLAAFAITFPAWLVSAILGSFLVLIALLTAGPIGWLIDTWNGEKDPVIRE